MKFLAAAGLAGACLATSPLLAADLFSSAPPPMDAPMDQPTIDTELGTNWYIRGDVGYGQTNQATVIPSAGLFPSIGNQPIGDANSLVPVTRGNNQTTMSPDFGLGFGYRVNDFFRVEADWSFSKGPGLAAQQKVFCPEVANAVSNYTYTNPVTTITGGVATTTYTKTAVPYGYQYDFTTCNGGLNVTQYNNTGLVMGYIDLGHWSLFTPYIGVGAGINVNTVIGTLKFNQTDTGVNYTGPVVNGSAPGLWTVNSGATDLGGMAINVPLPRPAPTSGAPQPIGPANWSRNINTTKYTFAASAAAGVGVQISQSATLDVGYHISTLNLMTGMKDLRHNINLGVRYNIN